jgi:hypothetical protein
VNRDPHSEGLAAVVIAVVVVALALALAGIGAATVIGWLT